MFLSNTHLRRLYLLEYISIGLPKAPVTLVEGAPVDVVVAVQGYGQRQKKFHVEEADIERIERGMSFLALCGKYATIHISIELNLIYLL